MRRICTSSDFRGQRFDRYEPLSTKSSFERRRYIFVGLDGAKIHYEYIVYEYKTRILRAGPFVREFERVK